MASTTNFLIALVAVVVMVAGPAMATEHWVGDDQGWKLDFNYTKWATTKEFHVGDKLIFKYKKDVHNVIKADQQAFQNCKPSSAVTPLTSGNDVIDLTSSGKKWYICGIGQHCVKGVKLAINVLEAESGSPAPSPSGPAPSPSGPAPSPNGPSPSSASWISPKEKFLALIVAAFAMFVVIIS